MILHALNDYYKRLAGDESSGIPLRGFSRQPVPFALEIAPDGTLKQVLDLRVQNGKKLVPRQLVVPEAVKRTVAVAPNFIWDNTGYVLGADEKGKPERAAKAFEAFRDKVRTVCAGVEDEGLAAVLSFLAAWSPEKASGLEHWDELSGQNVVFKLSTERGFVHERLKVCEAWLKHYFAGTSEVLGQCLVTGEVDQPIARLHADLKGVRGAQTKGAPLVGFNLDAFTSYGKEQSYNAPVSEEVTFNYTTALNDLLKRDSRQKVQIGDATTVFWTEKKSLSESLLPFVFGQGEDQGDQQKLRLFLEALRDGSTLPDEIKTEGGLRFYVLGLSPNAGRISVRFWHVDTVASLWAKVRRHFDDLHIVKRFDKEPDFPPQWLLLKAASKREDLDNLSPLLSGALMRSILTGAPYPSGLLSAVMGRIRAEQEITYARAALIKACLVRNARLRNQPLEVTVSLDEHSTNEPYRLGRLFAVLEKLQQEAIPGANTTIKDRYFGSASATPRAVFPILLRLSQHHISKIEYGRTYDRRIQDILDGVDIADGGFPAHLSLEEQGLFALGYYHQRKDLWTSKKNAPAETATATTED
ncbi:MAG: type I-C CRISPR-associated protein Cas8c/Csd1 [Desulfovibrio sp.]|jgi:CRISPR-associated protein Csd1|nr:type I-C CRISPR-associated protein Cas8c/Csd1 [Desulfovibrio sp.]